MESQFILALQGLLKGFEPVSIFFARWLIYLYIPFALYLWHSRKALRHGAYEASWSAALALALSTFLALLVGRVRPYLAVQGVEALVSPNIQTGSFPSSHTAMAFGIASALAFAEPRVGFAAFLMAVLIAFGRIAAGMHFPSDVLAGMGVGFIAFFMVRAVHRGLKATSR